MGDEGNKLGRQVVDYTYVYRDMRRMPALEGNMCRVWNHWVVLAVSCMWTVLLTIAEVDLVSPLVSPPAPSSHDAPLSCSSRVPPLDQLCCEVHFWRDTALEQPRAQYPRSQHTTAKTTIAATAATTVATVTVVAISVLLLLIYVITFVAAFAVACAKVEGSGSGERHQREVRKFWVRLTRHCGARIIQNDARTPSLPLHPATLAFPLRRVVGGGQVDGGVDKRGVIPIAAPATSRRAATLPPLPALLPLAVVEGTEDQRPQARIGKGVRGRQRPRQTWTLQ